MIKSLCLGLMAAAMMCGTAAAELSFVYQDSISVNAGMTESVNVFVFNFTNVAETLLYADASISPGLSGPISTISTNANWVGSKILNTGESQLIGTFSFLGAGSIPVPSVENFAVTGSIQRLGQGSPVLQSGLDDIVVNAVPEPTSVLLFGSLMTLGMIRRRSA